jgi:hypothetical protein
VWWGILCVLLIVLWVRSYSFPLDVIFGVRGCTIWLLQGQWSFYPICYLGVDDELLIPSDPTVAAPSSALVITSLAFAVAPWKFSLRMTSIEFLYQLL